MRHRTGRKNPKVTGMQALRALLPRFEGPLTTLDAHLKAKNIRYAICGGTACVVYGAVRTTDDIDVLVGDEAFGTGIVMDLKVPIKVGGVQVDTVPIPVDDEALADVMEFGLDNAVDVSGLPVVPLNVLLYMKLNAGRTKDFVAVGEVILATDDPRETIEVFEKFCEEFGAPLKILTRLQRIDTLDEYL